MPICEYNLIGKMKDCDSFYYGFKSRYSPIQKVRN